MPGANAVMKRAMSRSKYPKGSLKTSRKTTPTASLRMGGQGAHAAGGFFHANSTSEGRTHQGTSLGRI